MGARATGCLSSKATPRERDLQYLEGLLVGFPGNRICMKQVWVYSLEELSQVLLHAGLSFAAVCNAPSTHSCIEGAFGDYSDVHSTVRLCCS